MKILPAIFFSLFFFLILSYPTTSHSQTEKGTEEKDSTVTIKEIESQDEDKFIIYADSGRSSLKVYGEVRVNGALDKSGLQSEETFDVYNIPVGGIITGNERLFFGVFESRIGLDAMINTPIGDMEAKIEGDFNGANNTFRIRKAFAKYRNFLAGKTSSLFGDPDAIPVKVDRDGPNFSLSKRTVQIRFEYERKRNISWGVAVDNPEADITNYESDTIQPFYQNIPQLTSFIKKNFKNGSHIRLSGIFRNITVRNLDQNLQLFQGYGGLLSGQIFLPKKTVLYYQIFGGQSVASYIEAFNGEGLDLVFDTVTSSYEPVSLYGGFVSLSHEWSERLNSEFTYGLSDIEYVQSQPGNIFRLGYYGSVSLFYRPFNASEMGLEYSLGKKIAENEQTGTASRISFILYYFF